MLAVGAQELSDLVAGDHHPPVVGVGKRVLAPQEDQHERGVPAQGLLTAQHAGDVVAVLLLLERDLSLVVDDQVEVHLVQPGTEVVLGGQDPFPRDAVPGPAYVPIQQQGHQGTPGRLGETITGPVGIVPVPTVDVGAGSGAIAGACPRSVHCLPPCGP